MAIKLSDLPPKYQEQVIKKYLEQGKTPPIVPAQPAEQNKYHNQPTEREGAAKKIRFQSAKEARRYDELLLLFRAGVIRNLKLQPQFTLQESYITPDGERVQAIHYIADFSYEQQRPDSPDQDWQLVVEDVKTKATRTEKYKMKQKMMLERFGIRIKEI